MSAHYPNSGHSLKTVKIIADDWFRNFGEVPEAIFVNLIDDIIDTKKFFPVIGDVKDAMATMGLCSTCIYRENPNCDAAKKHRMNMGKDCGAFKKGKPEG